MPATGVALLALLWLLSAFDGWAVAAFCTGQGPGSSCRAHVAAAVRPSAIVSAVAAALAAAALLAPPAIRAVRSARATPAAAAAQTARSASAVRAARIWLLIASAACWMLALAVLFVAGEAASP